MTTRVLREVSSKCKVHRDTERTTGVKTVRVDLAFRPLGQLDGGEHVGGLRLEVRVKALVLFRVGVPDSVKVNAGTGRLRDTRDEHHTWDVVCGAGSEQFWRK